MLHVDNSGKGNCMYYAYSISLMYFLRAKRNPNLTEDIFNKLNLQENNRAPLRSLLLKKSHLEYTDEEIKTVIEPILGRATRDLAAEQTKNEFITSPQSTSLFTAAKYGFEYCFKVLLEANRSELAALFDHEFTNPDYTEAEIYRVNDMRPHIGSFVEMRLADVTERFNRLWAIKEKELKEQQQELTEATIKFHKANILLDQIIADELVAFFTADNNKYLNEYKNHLQRDSVWGTEETLFVLHRAIQGERLLKNQEGKFETFYDQEIILHLHRNSGTPFYQARQRPEIILNNQGNIHWTSQIPLLIFSRKPVLNKTYPTEITQYVRENKQTGPRVAKAIRAMYQEGLEGNLKYSPEYCREIAQHYLEYVKYKNRHFNLTDLRLFLKEMDAILDTAKVQPIAQNLTPVAEKDKLTLASSLPIKTEKLFPHYDENIAFLYETIYSWANTLTDRSFKLLINSALNKYESELGRFLGLSSSRRPEVESYLKDHTGAKALALIFINGQDPMFSECLFTKIVRIMKQEIARDPSMLQNPRHHLIADFNFTEHTAFYLANLKQYSEVIAASSHEEELASTVTFTA